MRFLKNAFLISSPLENVYIIRLSRAQDTSQYKTICTMYETNHGSIQN